MLGQYAFDLPASLAERNLQYTDRFGSGAGTGLFPRCTRTRFAGAGFAVAREQPA